MKKEKLYFENEDAELCHPLEHHIADARYEGLTEINLLEAIPDNHNKDYIFCTLNGSCGERQECNKIDCTDYIPVKGKGCKHRGKLFLHGEKVTFKIN